MKVKLTGPREGFNGVLAGIRWVDGKANVATLTQRLERGYGAVEDSIEAITEPEDVINELAAPIDPEEVFKDTKEEASSEQTQSESDETQNGAKELADVVANKKAEIERAAKAAEASEDTPNEVAPQEGPRGIIPEGMKKSDIKVVTDFTTFFEWCKYVSDLTGVRPKNKKQGLELIAQATAHLPD